MYRTDEESCVESFEIVPLEIDASVSRHVREIYGIKEAPNMALNILITHNAVTNDTASDR